jgi:uroporphyrin-III C-methyltransferase/precorrin-2 dehydrogenase/sirohydrochlorin ferrochelatase
MVEATAELLPVFLKLRGRRVLVVGAGPVAASKIEPLLRAHADVVVVAPEVRPEIEATGVAIVRRAFAPGDVDGAWLVVAAAPPEVNRAVERAASERRVFVNAVDDKASATAYLGAVLRRAGFVTIAVSTSGLAPAFAGVVRDAIHKLLPSDATILAWIDTALTERERWKRDGVPMADRREALREALRRRFGEGPI